MNSNTIIKANALIRGAFVKGLCLLSKHFTIHGTLMLFSRSRIRCRDNAHFEINSGVRIGENSLVSALRNGEIKIGKGTSIGRNNLIICHEKIEIGENTLLSPNVSIYDHDHMYSKENGVDKKNFKTQPVLIGSNCWIGANTVILKGTKIGNNCVIGAGSIIKGKYPDGIVVVQKREDRIL